MVETTIPLGTIKRGELVRALVGQSETSSILQEVMKRLGSGLYSLEVHHENECPTLSAEFGKQGAFACQCAPMLLLRKIREVSNG